MSVLQIRAERRAAAAPDLNLRVLIDPSISRLIVFVDNVGAVAATGANFVMVWGGQVDSDSMGNGFLGPGQSEGPMRRAFTTTTPPSGADYHPIVTCHDRFGVLHTVTHRPGRRRAY